MGIIEQISIMVWKGVSMRNKNLLILFGTFILTFIIAPCSFNQYQPNKIIKIQAKFPSNRSANSKLINSKTDEVNYVPPFVERIEMHLTGTDSSGQPIKKDPVFNRSDNNFTTPLSIYDVPYGSDFNLTVEAYSYNDILTHRGSASAPLIGSAPGENSISVDFDIESGTHFENEPITISLSKNAKIGTISPLLFDYCSDINDDGDIVFSYVDIPIDVPFMKFLVFNHNQNTPYIPANSPTDNTVTYQTCKFDNDKLYIPTIKLPSNTTLSVFEFTKSDGNYNFVDERQQIKSWNEGAFSNPQIDFFQDKIILAWERFLNSISGTFFQVFTIDGNGYIDFSGGEKLFCDNNCTKPLIKIVDEDQEAKLAMFSYYSGGPNFTFNVLGKLFNMNGTEYESGGAFHYYPEEGDINISDYYSFTKAIYNNPYILSFANMHDPAYVESVYLDTNLAPAPKLGSVPADVKVNVKQPMITNIRGVNLITVFSEESGDGSNEYDIYFYSSESFGNSNPQKELVSGTGDHIIKGTPKIATNDDGLTVISWVGHDMTNDTYNVYFKRYLF